MQIAVIAIRLWSRIRRRRGTGLLLVLGLVAIAILGNAVCFMVFDGADQDLSWSDALWYSAISITTIGYGDYSAASTGARIGTLIFIVGIGLSAFTLLLGLITDAVMEHLQRGVRGMGTVHASDHIVIVNHPGEQRLKQILRELGSDPHYGRCDVVLISDRISERPFDDGRLHFIHGSPLDEDSWQRAAVEKACLALILPVDMQSDASDAVTASVVAVLSRLAPGLRVVAECLDERRRSLFTTCGAHVSVVCGMQVAGNLLIQELSDDGVAATMEEISSNLRGTTLFATTVRGAIGRRYTDLAKALLDRGANLLSIKRAASIHTTFADLTAEDGDVVVYISERRYDWSELTGLIA